MTLLNWQDGVTVLVADWANAVEQTCDLASDLRAFNGSGGAEQVFIRGINAVNDGGQGAFYWNATASGVTDDNLNTIVPSGTTTGCWTRLTNGSTIVSTQTITSGSSTSLNSATNTLFVNVGNAFTANLPSSPFTGERHTIVDTSGNASTYNISVGGTINGQTNFVIDVNYGSVTVEYNGTNWSTVEIDTGGYISSTVLLASAVALTTGTAADVTHISLVPGDWDVTGNVAFAVASGTTITVAMVWTNSSSATLPTIPNSGGFAQIAGQTFTGASGGSTIVMTAGSHRFTVTTTTSVYLSAQSTFATSTNSVYGFIGARRTR
ncbi:MAG: hypothetical protein KGL39_43985 [Patescibacteria group bacterium]|nr:hypothetical protein [Patescibacteria group bacterium]